MRIRLFFRTALLGLMLILPAAVPAGAQSIKPALVLTLAPYDQLRSDLFYLSRLAGQEQFAAQIEMLIDLPTGNSGLRGIDRKKPMGAYFGWVGPREDDGVLVLLIPVTDQTAFFDMLGNLNIKPTQDNDGVYSANVENVPDPVYLRFAGGYAYVSPHDKRGLADDRLLAPGDALAGRNGSEASLTVNIDRVPDAFRDRVVAEFLQVMEEAKRRPSPFETAWQRKFRQAMFDESTMSLKKDLANLDEMSLRLDLDRAAGDIALTMKVAAKPGTTAAADLQKYVQASSITAGLMNKDAAISGTMYFYVPERIRGIFDSLIDDGRAETLANAKDQSERATLTTVFDAFMPTLRSSEFDGTFNLQGPDGNGLYTLVGGFRVKNGARMEQAFRNEAPKDPTTDVRFDVDRAGTVSIHRLVAPDMDRDGLRIFGGNTVYLAFRDDAVLVALGSGGLGAIKDALKVAPSIGKIMDFQITLSQLVPLADDPTANEAARKMFADKKDGDDRIRLTVEVGDNTETLRLTTKTKLIEYVRRLGEIK
jgi:hypothetical protein